MSPPTPPSAPGFARRLTLFDATMIVISGIIGSGIFINIFFTDLENALKGTLIFLLGVPVYFFWRRRRP